MIWTLILLADSASGQKSLDILKQPRIMPGALKAVVYSVMMWTLILRADSDSVYAMTPGFRGLFIDEPLVLSWMTSLPGTHILWCYWQHDVDGAWDRFLGYNNQESERLNISARHQGWDYTNSTSPCHGGIRRKDTTSHHGGLYRMIIGLYNGTEYKSPTSDVIVAACHAPPDVRNADRFVTMAKDHVLVTYTCNNVSSNAHNQISKMKCIPENGNWSAEAPDCGVRLSCPEEGDFVNIQGMSVLEMALLGLTGILVVAVILMLWILYKKRKTRSWIPHRMNKSNESPLIERTNEEQTPLSVLESDDPHGPEVARNSTDESMQLDVHTSSLMATDKCTDMFEFAETFSDTTVKLGKEITLSVSTSCKSVDRFTWKRNDEKLVTQKNKYKMGSDKNQSWLTLLKATEDMSGKYTCEVVNKDGRSISTSAYVLVTTGDEITADICAPKFSETFKSPLVIQVGEKAEKRFEIHGNPSPEVICRKDGEVIVDSDVFKIEKSIADAAVHVILTVEDPKLSDMCELRFDATNALGTKSITTELLVYSPLLMRTDLLDKTVGIGEDVSFEVSFDGFPLPNFEWYRFTQGAKLALESQEECEQYTVRSRVLIKDCMPEDEGPVAVNVTSGDSPVTKHAMLHVSKAVKPCFIQNLKRTEERTLGEDVRLTVEFEGHPMPDVKWFSQNVLLEPSRHVTISCRSPGTSELCITEVTPQDAGDIRVEASNMFGAATSHTRLEVKDRQQTLGNRTANILESKSIQPTMGLPPVDIRQ